MVPRVWREIGCQAVPVACSHSCACQAQFHSGIQHNELNLIHLDGYGRCSQAECFYQVELRAPLLHGVVILRQSANQNAVKVPNSKPFIDVHPSALFNLDWTSCH